MSDSQRTELKELGEFGLIKRLTENFESKLPSTIKGVGDDAAIIDSGEGQIVVSTDMLLEGIHFDLAYTPLKHLGYKAVVVNLSDVAAMNAIPEQITVSIAVSNRVSVEALDEIYSGIKAACETYSVDLVGGDTTSSLHGLMISVTAIGRATAAKVTRRNTAKEGDMICITGDLGGAYIGLQLLEREKHVFMANPDMQPQLDDHEYLVHRLLKPEARMDVIHQFSEREFIPSAMIDVSDGLASELLHIALNSGVGVEVWDENVPVDNRTYEQALEFNIDPATCALNGGEDYELLFTCSKDEFKRIENLPDIMPIGEVKKKEEGYAFITKKGNRHELKAQGWVAF